MSEVRISYIPRSDATPQSELNTLAAVYKFVLAKKKEAAPESRPDDTKEGLNGSCRNTIIPERP